VLGLAGRPVLLAGAGAAGWEGADWLVRPARPASLRGSASLNGHCRLVAASVFTARSATPPHRVAGDVARGAGKTVGLQFQL